VLYEMLPRRPAFAGETTSDVIAAIIERKPDLTLLPPTIHAHVRSVIERCLEKDPKRRARDIADVRHALDAREADVGAPSSKSWAVPVTLAVVGIAVIAAVVAALRWWPAPATTVAAPVEFTFGAPPGYSLAPVHASLSPDGRSIAFVARSDKQINAIFLRSLEAATARRLDGTEDATGVVWSPDGRSVAFFVGGLWKRIGIAGGPPVTIVATCGVLYFGWTFANHFGRSPSRDIAKKIRGWPI
jgi:serine/threonine-protein kinase